MRDAVQDPLRIELQGEFDMGEVDRLARLLRPIHEADAVVIDLTRVRYFDSTALACLVHAAKRRSKDASRVVLEGASGHIRRVLTIANLDAVFDVVA